MMSDDAPQNIISFVAHNAARVEVHRHHCFQIVASIKGSFACTIDGKSYQRKIGFIINQSVVHSCQAQGASVIVYFIDAESYYGWQLREMLAGKPFLDIEDFFAEGETARICANGNERLPKFELKKIADEIFETVLPQPNKPDRHFLDGRIGKALKFIETNLRESIRLEDVADQMFLSPERARHLFVQATGSPFSQFLLWKRIKAVIIASLTQGLSLTEAALKCGFSDQAHFCRVFKRTFGMSPKTHLKNSRFVQFLNPLV